MEIDTSRKKHAHQLISTVGATALRAPLSRLWSTLLNPSDRRSTVTSNSSVLRQQLLVVTVHVRVYSSIISIKQLA